MIGEAPDRYIQDAKEHKKKNRFPRWSKWAGGIAAVLVIALLISNIPGIPTVVSAKSVAAASESRRQDPPKSGSSPEAYASWLAQQNTRNELTAAAVKPLADFSALVSKEIMTGTEDENRVWSPVNAYIALAMTAELAEGETQTELLDVLDADSTAELRSRISALWEQVYADNSREISVLANSLWLDNDLAYAQEKMDILAYDYYSSVYQGDLGSEKMNRAITNWMRNQTGGLLKDRTGKVDLPAEDQMLVIASTIYFQSQWTDEFDKGDNTDGVFHAAAGDKAVTFMNKKEYPMSYCWDDDYSAVRMSLENGSSMWFILPDEGKTAGDVLADGGYMEMITKAYSGDEEDPHSKTMKVNLSVPRFDVSAGIDLKPALQNAGLTKVFDWTQNGFASSLQSKTGGYPVYLAAIHQDTRVKADEKGVAAASYIELDFGAGSAMPPDEIIDFVLDRPFIFAVTKRDIPLFIGTVNEP